MLLVWYPSSYTEDFSWGTKLRRSMTLSQIKYRLILEPILFPEEKNYL